MIQATQTELGFFLVIIFVLLLGFETSKKEQVAGTGTATQAPSEEIPFDPATESALLVPWEVSAKSKPDKSEWREYAEQALRHIRSCEVIRSETRRSFILPTDQLTKGDDKALTFSQGEDRISDDLWQNCLAELFQAVISTYKAHRSDTRHIVIQGHTSSEWNDGKGCPGVARADGAVRRPLVDYKCNRLLSVRRAESIYEAGFFFNDIWHKAGADHSLEPRDFVGVFRTEGRSSLDLVRLPSGEEDKSASRRVEFVFVGTEVD